MLNQTRVDGLLHYMDEIGLCQMVIRNPVLIRYMLGYTPRGNDRATILYVSKTNGVTLQILQPFQKGYASLFQRFLCLRDQSFPVAFAVTGFQHQFQF